MRKDRRVHVWLLTLTVFVGTLLLPLPDTGADGWGCSQGCMVCRYNWLGDRYCGFSNEENGQCNCTDWWMGDQTGCHLSGEYCFGIIVDVL